MIPRRILQILEQISLDVEVDQSAVTVIATKSTMTVSLQKQNNDRALRLHKSQNIQRTKNIDSFQNTDMNIDMIIIE